MMIDRKAVLAKYNNHCAYCGKVIDLKSMQVDHIHPIRLGGTDDFDNLNPSCRMCNHYKRGNTLDGYRKLLSGLGERLEKIYIYKVAVAYGLVIPDHRHLDFGADYWRYRFYFELFDMYKAGKSAIEVFRELEIE